MLPEICFQCSSAAHFIGIRLDPDSLWLLVSLRLITSRISSICTVQPAATAHGCQLTRQPSIPDGTAVLWASLGINYASTVLSVSRFSSRFRGQLRPLLSPDCQTHFQPGAASTPVDGTGSGSAPFVSQVWPKNSQRALFGLSRAVPLRTLWHYCGLAN